MCKYVFASSKCHINGGTLQVGWTCTFCIKFIEANIIIEHSLLVNLGAFLD